MEFRCSFVPSLNGQVTLNFSTFSKVEKIIVLCSSIISSNLLMNKNLK